MKPITKILAGGIGLAALAGAAPAAAQYYPNPYPAPAPNYGQGYGYGQSGGIAGIIESLLGQNRYRGGVDQRPLVERCIAVVTNQIARRHSGTQGRYGAPYGYGNYGYNQSNAQVLGITEVDQRRAGIRVRGIATAGGYAAAPYGGGRYGAPYGQAYGYQQPPQGELTFRCNIDWRGRILDVDIDPNRNAYRYRR